MILVSKLALLEKKVSAANREKSASKSFWTEQLFVIRTTTKETEVNSLLSEAKNSGMKLHIFERKANAYLLKFNKRNTRKGSGKY